MSKLARKAIVLWVIAALFWAIFFVALFLPRTAHGVEIVGPPGNELLVDPIEPGRYVRLGIRDVDPALLNERGLIWYPQDGVEVRPGRPWGDGEHFVDFRADKPGYYQIGLYVILDGGLDRSVVVIQVGKTQPVPPPDPDPPPPDPDPQPDPIPPPPVVEPVVIIIEETSERTPEQFRAMAAPAWRQWVIKRDGMVRIVDKDIADEHGKTPEDLKEWIEGAKALPYQFFACGKGIVRWEGGFPVDDGAVLAILKKHGGE